MGSKYGRWREPSTASITDATGSDPGLDDDGAVIPMFANYVFVDSAKLGREDDMSSN